MQMVSAKNALLRWAPLLADTTNRHRFDVRFWPKAVIGAGGMADAVLTSAFDPKRTLAEFGNGSLIETDRKHAR